MSRIVAIHRMQRKFSFDGLRKDFDTDVAIDYVLILLRRRRTTVSIVRHLMFGNKFASFLGPKIRRGSRSPETLEKH